MADPPGVDLVADTKENLENRLTHFGMSISMMTESNQISKRANFFSKSSRMTTFAGMADE